MVEFSFIIVLSPIIEYFMEQFCLIIVFFPIWHPLPITQPLYILEVLSILASTEIYEPLINS